MKSTTKHTAEPWRVGDAGATIFGPPNGSPSPETICSMAGPRGNSKANRERIVSCVNALARVARPEAVPVALGLLRQLMEFWDNGTPVHPGAEIAADLRSVLRVIDGAEWGGE